MSIARTTNRRLDAGRAAARLLCLLALALPLGGCDALDPVGLVRGLLTGACRGSPNCTLTCGDGTPTDPSRPRCD